MRKIEGPEPVRFRTFFEQLRRKQKSCHLSDSLLSWSVQGSNL